MAIEEGIDEKLFIKLTNHLTGEITEVEVGSAEQAKNLLFELTASQRVIGKALEDIKYYLDRFLGPDEEYRFADGKVLKRKQLIRLNYRPEVLRKYLDEDQLQVCLKVDMTTTNALVQEMMEKGELPGDTLKKIREEADQVASKPWVEVR